MIDLNDRELGAIWDIISDFEVNIGEIAEAKDSDTISLYLSIARKIDSHFEEQTGLEEYATIRIYQDDDNALWGDINEDHL